MLNVRLFIHVDQYYHRVQDGWLVGAVGHQEEKIQVSCLVLINKEHPSWLVGLHEEKIQVGWLVLVGHSHKI